MNQIEKIKKGKILILIRDDFTQSSPFQCVGFLLLPAQNGRICEDLIPHEHLPGPSGDLMPWWYRIGSNTQSADGLIYPVAGQEPLWAEWGELRRVDEFSYRGVTKLFEGKYRKERFAKAQKWAEDGIDIIFSPQGQSI